MNVIKYVDSHAHLIMRDRDGMAWAQARISKAAAEGVVVITVAQVARMWDVTLQLITDYDNVFAVLAASHSEVANLETFERLVKICRDEPRVVGIGEVGLDYRQGRPQDIAQRKDHLREHIQIAREVNLPLVIHDGKATEDILKILEEESAKDVGGMIHFFTGTPRQAQAAIDLGFYLSLGGPHTYAKPLADLVRSLPLERMLVETDSPMLAGPRKRKQQENEPVFVMDVVKGIAEMRGMDEDKLRQITTENAIRLFRLDED